MTATFEGLSGATFGANEAEALREAEDLLVSALSIFVDEGKPHLAATLETETLFARGVGHLAATAPPHRLNQAVAPPFLVAVQITGTPDPAPAASPVLRPSMA